MYVLEQLQCSPLLLFQTMQLLIELVVSIDGVFGLCMFCAVVSMSLCVVSCRVVSCHVMSFFRSVM